MTRLIRAEALRLATTRTYWLLAAGAIALIAGPDRNLHPVRRDRPISHNPQP